MTISRTLCLIAGAAVVALGAARAQETCAIQNDFAVALHGGAFTDGEPTQDQLAFLETTATAARTQLGAGKTALEVVEWSVGQMEASALFNAGRASIVNEQGYVENDASIMEGANLNAGAVGSLLATKSPIKAARLVMEKSRHVMVAGDRGERYVRNLGAEAAPSDWFTLAEAETDEPHGTVGAVALDRCGNLAAGTSTGGYDAKVPGRLGDVPVIGAGTYADNRGAAVSATGHGEWFIRHAAAHSISKRVELLGEDAQAASDAVIREMAARRGFGAVITITAAGDFAVSHSSRGIMHAFASDEAEPYAALFAEE